MRSILSAALMAAFFVSPAFGQQSQCGDRSSILKALTEKYGEAPVGRGMASNGAIVEIYANTETGSWTILVNLPNGMTCVPADGRNWEVMDFVAPVSGDPT